jgi:hypothetical protein
MNPVFDFEEVPLEELTEFDIGTFDTELANLEWEEEFR